MPSQRILITGGAGFIGSNLITYLEDKSDYAIAVLDNESLGHRDVLSAFDIEFHAGDIRDESVLEKAMTGVDTIIHLAADTRVIESIENPAHNFDVNVVGTFKVLQSARKLGVKRVINASTGGAILGEATPPIHEDMVAKPLAPYGASKLSAEAYCSGFHGAFGLQTVSLRFSNVYGPLSFHKGSVVAHFFKQILNGDPLTVYGDGNQTRDYLFAGDLVKGVHNVIESDSTGVYQLGSGKGVTLNDLITEIRDVVGPDYSFDVNKADWRDGEVRQSWCDISKARREFNFEPATPLWEGLHQTWQWFLANQN